MLALLPAEAAADEFDNEHLFGFTQGTDIGRKGDKELEFAAHGHLGKRQGRYSAVTSEVEGKFTVLDHVRVSPSFALAHHHIRGVPGLADRSQWNVEGAAFETKVRVVDRASNPVGITLGLTPAWSRIDGTSGERTDGYGAGFLFSLDRELVPGKTIAAFNVTYDAGATHSAAAWTHDSATGVSGAVATRVHDGIFIGAELRYARAYDGMAMDRFLGHALFIGPTFYAKLSETVWMAAAWNAQVAGRSNAERAIYDLSNFERHELLVRLGIAF